MKNNILCYLEFPPPVHGQTYINSIIYAHLKESSAYKFYDTNFSTTVAEVGSVSTKKVSKNLRIILGAWKAFLKHRPKTVYSIASATNFGLIRDFLILLPAFIFSKKIVLHLHGFTYYKIYKTSVMYKILFKILSLKSSYIVLCEKQKSEMQDSMNLTSFVLPNCITKDVVTIKKKKNDVLKLCYISNISKAKGTLDLIKAVNEYNGSIELVIAGNFLDNKDEFMNMISNNDSIKYIGFANEEQKKAIFESSDIFCLPSKLEEGSPISIIEAMSYALPVLSTNKGCIKDMITDSGVILQDSYQYSDIKDALDYINLNYDKLSLNALTQYNQKYSETKFIQNLKNVLEGTIDVQK